MATPPRYSSWWLQPAGRHPRRTEITGTALLVALYTVTVFAFWWMG
jgi:hypothetical protein